MISVARFEYKPGVRGRRMSGGCVCAIKTVIREGKHMKKKRKNPQSVGEDGGFRLREGVLLVDALGSQSLLRAALYRLRCWRSIKED